MIADHTDWDFKHFKPILARLEWDWIGRVLFVKFFLSISVLACEDLYHHRRILEPKLGLFSLLFVHRQNSVLKVENTSWFLLVWAKNKTKQTRSKCFPFPPSGLLWNWYWVSYAKSNKLLCTLEHAREPIIQKSFVNFWNVNFPGKQEI